MKVLVVDDERSMRRVLQILLEQMGLESVSAENGQEALEHLRRENISLVLTDLRMPEMTGIELLEQIRAADAEVPVIVFTAYGTVQTAVEAMKHGAFDYILKPFDVEAVEPIIRRALDLRRYRNENRYLKEQATAHPALESLVVGSPAMQEVCALIHQIAETKSSVLITGETGRARSWWRAPSTISARAATSCSCRSTAPPFPATCWRASCSATCAAPSPARRPTASGKFEVADRGTLFLDEIGDMPHPHAGQAAAGSAGGGRSSASAATSGRASTCG